MLEHFLNVQTYRQTMFAHSTWKADHNILVESPEFRRNLGKIGILAGRCN